MLPEKKLSKQGMKKIDCRLEKRKGTLRKHDADGHENVNKEKA